MNLPSIRQGCRAAMSRPVLPITLALLLTACATTTWSRPTTTVVEFERDNQACQHMNSRMVSISPALVQTYVMPAGYARCMEEEGYTHGGPWEGHSGWRHE
jgi:hypothetical protein